MAVQPNLNAPSLVRIAQSTGGGVLLVGLAFLVSRYGLARLFEASARRPELVLLTSIAWCFVTSGSAEYLGLSREMGALIAGISIKARITVVDYNANLGRTVRQQGFHWEYGDLAHPDALEHLGVERARIIVTTISDTFLKGIRSRSLVAHLRRLAPHATIVMTGEEQRDLKDLIRGGADHVLIPGEITGERILELLEKAAQG